MTEWKSMMENNIKVASEMQNMLAAFGGHVRPVPSGNGADEDDDSATHRELITANTASLEYGLHTRT
jgi:hypothetical protein